MTEEKKLLEFPCQFPIKVIGESSDEFEAHVVSIIRKHVPKVGEAAFNLNASKKGKYTAITVVVEAQSQQHLDDIYHDLSISELVIMAL